MSAKIKTVFKAVIKAPEFYIAIVMAVCLSLFWSGYIAIKDVSLNSEGTTLPIIKKFGQGEVFNVKFSLVGDLDQNYMLRIIPDDCVQKINVNGNELNLQGRSGLCDYGRGFALWGSEVRNLGVTRRADFEIEIVNRGGDGGIKVSTEVPEHSMRRVLVILLAVLSALLTFFACKRARVNMGIAVVLALGVALRMGFSLDLPRYDKFGYDVDGHVAYVNYIAEHWKVPTVDDCWTCYHPPVYYALSVPAWKAGEVMGISGASALNAESFLLSVALLIIGFAFFSNIMKGPPLVCATVLLAFWPMLVLAAPRIGNDQMFYLLHGLCLWLGVKYLNGGRGKYILAAAVVTALAFWTKSSGVVTLGTWLFFALFGYVNNARSLKPQKTEIAGWLFFGATVIAIVIMKLVGDSALVGNASGLNSALRVGNEPGNYLFFDLKTFITEPYTSAWQDELGRQYFWNYAMKSSLFGEFKLLQQGAGPLLATLISISFLWLVVCGIRGFWRQKLGIVTVALAVQIVAFFAALMYLRISFPYSCSNDFRYIAPVLLSFIPFAAMGIHAQKASPKWVVMGWLAVICFAVCSAALMLI
ncbi:MAG: glycosyltransferase family 39 protein [Fibrobacter sp.]|nr:glycosyltransferase family 39 protein [Fibrobacter sp.]